MSNETFSAKRQKLLREIRDLAGDLSSTNYTRIHGLIRRDIILGQFAANARLKTSELSSRYGLSPVPIREALQKLAGEGLVYFSPNKGVTVRSVDADFIREIHELRELVASHITSQSVTAMSDETIEDLKVTQDLFEEMLRSGENKMIILTNRYFHDTLDRDARNDVMKRNLGTHFELLETLRNAVGYTDLRKQEMQADHKELIEVSQLRDGKRAAEIMARHVRRARDDYLEGFLEHASRHPAAIEDVEGVR